MLNEILSKSNKNERLLFQKYPSYVSRLLSSGVLCILQAFHHLTFKSSRFYLFSHYFDSHNNQISTIYCRHAMDCAPQLLATNATSHKLTSHNLFTISTWAKPAVLRVYVENQAILERILLDHALKCKQTKEQGSRDCLWTYIFTFLRNYYTFFFLFSTKMQI